MTQPQTWQESLNPQLAQRLIRPLVQPGVINTQIARKIIERSQRFTNRLPLLANRRWASVNSLQSGQTPIVYAQGQPPVTSTESGQESLDSPSLEADKLPVVQAKLVSNAQSQPVPHQPAHNSPTLPSDYPITSPLPLSENKIDSPLLVQRKTDSGQESLDSPSLEAGKLPVVPAKLVSKAQSQPVPHQPVHNSPTLPSDYPITSPLPLSENKIDSPLLVQRKTDSGQESLDSPSLETGKLPVVQAKLVSNAQSQPVPHQPAHNSPTLPSDYPITSPLPLSENKIDLPLLVQRKTESGQESLDSPSLEAGKLPVVQAKLVSKAQSQPVPHQPAHNSPTVPSRYPITLSSSGQDVGRNRYSQVVVVSERTEAAAPPTPLVFSKMTTEVRPETNSTNQAAADSNQTRQRMPGAGGQGGFSIEGLQAQNYPEAIANHSQRSEPVPVAQVDVEEIANKVERKLMRRLVVESERRGKMRWP